MRSARRLKLIHQAEHVAPSLEGVPESALLTVKALMNALQARDAYTYGHCLRVARNARLLARAAGLDHFQQNVIEFSSLFHDLGKIGIPDRVLLKESRLTAEEEEIIRLHPVKSVDLVEPLAKIPFFRFTLPGIRHHHERIDGRGYPDAIYGDQIPLTARVILVADTFDAMTTNRPYRKALPVETAFKELELFKDRQFDRQLVDLFVQSQPHWRLESEPTLSEIVTGYIDRLAA